MPRNSPFHIELRDDEAAELLLRTKRYTLPYFQVLRAQMILLAADGWRNDQIAEHLNCRREVVAKWRKRFFERRLAGLDDRDRPGRPRVSPQRSSCKSKLSPVSCLRRTECPRRDGAGRSSRGMCRKPARSAPSVAARSGGGFPRTRFVSGNIDPGSSPATPGSLKRRHPSLIGISADGRANPSTMTSSSFRRTRRRASRRVTVPIPPCPPALAVKCVSNTKTNGAAPGPTSQPSTCTGPMLSDAVRRKTGITLFRRLVEQIMTTAPYRPARRVFWIVGNTSSHHGARSIQRARTWNPRLQIVHTSCQASWLNQIEIYFTIVQRKVLTPNGFASTAELADRLRNFERHFAKIGKPFEWTFTRHDLTDLLKILDSPSLADAAWIRYRTYDPGVLSQSESNREVSRCERPPWSFGFSG